MELQTIDPALQAANLALSGRRMERAASRFASIELRGLEQPPPSDRRNVIWEVAAVCSVGVAALASVLAVWLL